MKKFTAFALLAAAAAGAGLAYYLVKQNQDDASCRYDADDFDDFDDDEFCEDCDTCGVCEDAEETAEKAADDVAAEDAEKKDEDAE